MNNLSTIRNVLIIVVLAALVDLVPGGGTAASVLVEAIWIAFLALLVWVAARLYRRHDYDLDSLDMRHQSVLYGSIGVIVVALTAGPRLRQSSFGTVLWLMVLLGSGYAIYAVYSSLRRY